MSSSINNPLLDALVLYTKLYHKPFTAESLVAGLPKEENEDTPSLFSEQSSKGLFSRAAKRAGLISKIVHKNLRSINKLVLPAILILKAQSACILEEFDIKNGKAKIILPEADGGENWVRIEELEEEFTGYVIYLKKEFKNDGKNTKTLSKNDGHWFWGTLKYSKSLYRDVFLASFVINLFLLATPLFTMNVYDRVVPNNALDTLWVLAIGISVIYIFDFFLKLTRTHFLDMAAKKSDIIISSVLFEHVLDIKMSARPKSIGSFANSLKDFDSIRNFIASSTLAVLIDLPFVVIFLAVVFFIGGGIVFIPILTTIMVLSYVLIVRKPLQKSVVSTYEAASKKNSVLIEALTNLETIKTLRANGYTQNRWEESVGEIARKGSASRLIGSSIPTVTQLLMQLNTVFIVVFGVYQISNNDMTMGALIATTMLAGRAIAPVGQVAGLISQYENTKTAFNGLEDIMAMPVERPDGKKFVERPEFTGDIEFQNVSFKFSENDRWVLKDISFKISHGESVALIGKIGSGKTTIEKLILGLYEPTEGTILIDGIDINQINPMNLRKNISYVPQDINLFQGTARDNIVYTAQYASDSEIIRAAKISGAEDFINRHPLGYDLEVGERGEGLSGGQRQSIAIARAFIVDTPIVILDEPTNMMDNTTEEIVKRNLKEAIKNKTTILVTHRSSLLDLANRLIVLEQGKIVIDNSREVVLEKLQANQKMIKQNGK